MRKLPDWEAQSKYREKKGTTDREARSTLEPDDAFNVFITVLKPSDSY